MEETIKKIVEHFRNASELGDEIYGSKYKWKDLTPNINIYCSNDSNKHKSVIFKEIQIAFFNFPKITFFVKDLTLENLIKIEKDFSEELNLVKKTNYELQKSIYKTGKQNRILELENELNFLKAAV